MSSRELYRRFTRLCQKWPTDPSKEGRDYAEVFRNLLIEHFPQGELGEVRDPKKVEAVLNPLERIAANSYYNENPLKRSSSSGLEASACRETISNEGIKLIHEQEEIGLISRLRRNLSMTFVPTKSEGQVPKELPEQNSVKKIDATKK